MLYRRLGRAGLKGSVLALGTGAMHNLGDADALAIFKAALEAGITHFDTAESYGGGQTEYRLGTLLQTLGIARDKFILSTKAFTYGWSDPTAAPHQVRTLNRKYLLHALDRSLAKLRTDHVDLFYCHQADPDTPIEEIVDTMSEVVQSGKARYWAISNWPADLLDAASSYAARHGRHGPIINQIEYNLLHRATADAVVDASRSHGLGIAVWGPLAGGLLSGKYRTGVPGNSRAADPAMNAAGIGQRLVDSQRNAIVAKLDEVAQELGCSVGQLSIAWCLGQPQVATVIIAASNVRQLEENLGALDVVDRLTPDVLARLKDIVGGHDQSNIPEALPQS